MKRGVLKRLGNTVVFVGAEPVYMTEEEIKELFKCDSRELHRLISKLDTTPFEGEPTLSVDDTRYYSWGAILFMAMLLQVTSDTTIRTWAIEELKHSVGHASIQNMYPIHNN